MDLASSLTVIGWFVQVLLDKGITFAIDHWGGAEACDDLYANLRSLRKTIDYVGVLLPISQKTGSENEGLLNSVNDLKDAAYDAEDILSELDYYRLQEEVEGKDNEDSQASTSSSPPSVTIIDRIKEVVARLNHNIARVSTLLNLLKSEEHLHADSHVSPSYRVTTSFVSPKQIMFGREETKAQIIDLLLSGQPAAASNVRVLPIIGAGGIGKTTLARVVYNDDRVVEHFDCRIWLYVSENFDVPRLTREVLESLGVPGSNNTTNQDKLQRLVKEKLGSKKFLLVLDDVWNDTNSEKWEMLCGFLQFGKPGSRILLTTRLDTVVRMVDRCIDVLDCSFKLIGLPVEELLSLFNKYAFHNEVPSDHLNLAKIGKQIVEKLNGSPWAAKVVGSLLNEKLDVEHWRRILSMNIWELPQLHDDIMPSLKLSYQNLPLRLQPCFAYCSVFPKGELPDKEELVRMWIAHGYIDTKTIGNKTMTETGREYFNYLLERSFFEYTKNGVHDLYSVQDLFYALAQSISADECFIIDTNNQQVPERVRHLSLSFDSIDRIALVQERYLKNLRTLIITKKIHVDAELFAELLSKLKSVRAICLLRLDQQLPHNMGHLIHLRYLRVDNYKEECRVPDSLVKLYQLQYAGNARKSLTLPEIEKLTRLQQLDCFIIEEGRKIGELKNLNQLEGSLILKNLENVSTDEDALKAELSKKMHILNLNLCWNNSHIFPEREEKVFEGLRPPAYIKKLSIDGYGGVNTPTWMLHEIQYFRNLESLFLVNCLKWKDLPHLGLLPCLKRLMISACEELQSLPVLPTSLEELRIEDCPQLLTLFTTEQANTMSELFTTEQANTMSELRILVIIGCPQLMSAEMKSLSSLKRVHIRSCNRLLSLPLLPATLEDLLLENLEWVTDLNMEQEEKLSDLTSLRKLQIFRCPRLSSLPLLPARLRELTINKCPQLPRQMYQEGGVEWNKVSHIPEIFLDR